MGSNENDPRTATDAFSVKIDGRDHTYDVGDVVPDDVAVLVGDHLLSRPLGQRATEVDDETLQSADEQVAQALVEAREKIGKLEAVVSEQAEELERLREFHEKVTNGDVEGLDLDWLGAPDDDAKSDGQDGGGAPVPTFDPAEHSVPEVLTYLESASVEESERVRAAEATGKKRAGILGSGD